MQASKWLEIQVLMSAEEMEALFTHLQSALGLLRIYLTGIVTSAGRGEVDLQDFLETHRFYISALKESKVPEESKYRTLFSSVLSLSPEMLTILNVGQDRQLLRLVRPVVQMQAHSMGYSEQDGKFYSMVFGPDSIAWGIQFSYPQIFLDPDTKEVMKVVESPEFPNTALFRQIQRWVRYNTIPTPMQTPGGSVNLPVRLGKACLSWINHHPHFKNRFKVIT